MADGMSDFTNLTTAILQIMVLMQFGLVVLNLSGMRSVPQCGSAWVLDSGPTHRGEQISAKRHAKPRRYRALVLTSCRFNRIHYLLLKLHQYSNFLSIDALVASW